MKIIFVFMWIFKFKINLEVFYFSIYEYIEEDRIGGDMFISMYDFF